MTAMLVKKKSEEFKIYDFTDEFIQLIESYNNTVDKHREIWEKFYSLTNSIPYLKEHRDYVEKNAHGYGDRAFHYLWKLLIEQMKNEFSFLEIGVYKGQVISLVNLICSKENKSPRIYGITPLSGSGDKYKTHPDVDYEGLIKKIHLDFRLGLDQTKIIKGFSNDSEVISDISKIAPFDVVYIDGCHDYEVVVSDIEIYKKMIKNKGLLVVDDSSSFLNMPKRVSAPNCYRSWAKKRKRRAPWYYGFSTRFKNKKLSKGLIEVSQAVSDTVEKDRSFSHLFACGHNRVWLKLE